MRAWAKRERTVPMGMFRIWAAEARYVAEQDADAQSIRKQCQGVFQLFVEKAGHQVHTGNVGRRGVGRGQAGDPALSVVQVIDEEVGENSQKPGPDIGTVLDAAF